MSITTLPDKQQAEFIRHFNKALLHHAANRIDQAIKHYRLALDCNPDHLPSLQVIALLMQQNGQHRNALDYYRHAIGLNPHSPVLHNAIANCYDSCSLLQQARYHYKQAINLRQDYAEALNNYGNICRKLGDYETAEQSLLDALRLNISVETLANLGLLMAEKKKYSAASSFYDHALRIQPENARVLWNKSLLLLSRGELKHGWALYDQGLAAKTRPNQISIDKLPEEKYNREFFRDKVLHIHREQGIGDEIMFASCLAEIIAISKKCIVETDDRLVPLFQRSFKQAKILPRSEILLAHNHSQDENIDVHISIASLPRFLRHSFDDFPQAHHYLLAYKQATSAWKNRYKKLGDKFAIGISWRGGFGDQGLKRSAELNDWSALLHRDDCQFVNLQYGQVDEELKQFADIVAEWPDTDHFHNLEQLAAQISALDLVITVSNVTAHLAGALGKPVWIILPYATNWRWFNGRNPCPWYKQARLFKQNTAGDWQSLFSEVNRELEKLLQSKQVPKKPLLIND